MPERRELSQRQSWLDPGGRAWRAHAHVVALHAKLKGDGPAGLRVSRETQQRREAGSDSKTVTVSKGSSASTASSWEQSSMF